MTALGAFSSGDVLTAADLNAIGTWTAFTPAWVNFTVGDATHSWYYAQINDLFIVTGKTTLGSTSSMGTNPYFPTPTGVTWQSQNHGTAEFGDAGTASRQGVMVAFSSTNIVFGYYSVSGSIVNRAAPTATTPFEWTTNDTIGGTLVGYAT